MLLTKVPRIYQKIVPKTLLKQNLNETKANCIHCQKNPILKCCSFFPFISNFLLGEILVYGSDQQKKSIENLIASKNCAYPIGLCAPIEYQRKYRNADLKNLSADDSLKCPFFDRGTCSIWSFRPPECFSFFCESSYAETGLSWWADLSQKFFDYDMLISQLAMLEFGFSWAEVEMNMAKINGEMNAFNEWPYYQSREIEFYRKCFHFAMNLDPVDLENELSRQTSRSWGEIEEKAGHLGRQSVK